MLGVAERDPLFGGDAGTEERAVGRRELGERLVQANVAVLVEGELRFGDRQVEDVDFAGEHGRLSDEHSRKLLWVRCPTPSSIVEALGSEPQ